MSVKSMIEKQLADLEKLSDLRPLETEEIKNLETLVKTLKNLPESDILQPSEELTNEVILTLLNGTD